MTTVWQQLDPELLIAVADVQTEYKESRKSLRLAGNNLPPVPRDPLAARVHRSFMDGDSNAVRDLLMLLDWNGKLGMQWPEQIRPLRRMERFLEARAAARHMGKQAARPILPLLRQEQRSNHAFDMDEGRVQEEHPNLTPETLRAAIASGRAQIARTQDAVEAMERELVALTVSRGIERHVYGRRMSARMVTQ